MSRPRNKTARYQYYEANAHLTKTEMAKELGIPRGDVSRDLKRYQLPSETENIPHIDEQKAELIIRNFRKLRYVLLAEMVGVKPMSIKHFVRRAGYIKHPKKSHPKLTKVAA